MELVPFLREFGMPLTALVVILFTMWKEMWVPGPTHKDVKAQRDKAQAQVDRLLELAYKNAAVQDKQTDVIKEAHKTKD